MHSSNTTNNYAILQFDRAKFWVDNGVLCCELNNPDDNSNLDIQSVEDYIDAITYLCKGNAMPFVIDLRNTQGNYLAEAAKKIASNTALSKLCLMDIFVANSLKMKLVISSFKRLYNTITPYQIFTDYKTAMQYALTIKNSTYGSN